VAIIFSFLRQGSGFAIGLIEIVSYAIKYKRNGLSVSRIKKIYDYVIVYFLLAWVVGEVMNREAIMYKTILVPLDGSKRAEAILPHIEEMSTLYHARVIFVQVVEPPPLILGPEGDIALHQQEVESLEKQAEAYLSAIQGTFEEKRINTKKYVIHGFAVEAILKVAEQEGADLIALASHGRRGLSQVFYGSVAAGVLNRIDRPLLLIRSRGNE
jgi:nucleotide-binding universal stress UspA family protein